MSDNREPKNPYESPQTFSQEEYVSVEHSIYEEPWIRADVVTFTTDEELRLPPSPSTDVGNSVWDEPGRSEELSGQMPPEAENWWSWYCAQKQNTSLMTSWLTTGAIMVAAGVVAIVSTIISNTFSEGQIVLTVFAAPITEEILKIALPLYVCEIKPWLFKSVWQIILCGIAAGVGFAVIENLIYLNFYFPNPSPELFYWRWTVCVGLHTLCSLLAAYGCTFIWKDFQSARRRPQITAGSRWFVVAILIHAAYNSFAIATDGNWK